MPEILNQERTEFIPNMVSALPCYNRFWGAEYMLMDSNSFLGKTGDERYDNLISIFNNIWKTYEYRLLGSVKKSASF